jgi:hypothetical protein
MEKGIPNLLNEKEISKIVRRSIQTLRNDRHMSRGLPYIRSGRSILYSLDDVVGYLQARRIDPEEAK